MISYLFVNDHKEFVSDTMDFFDWAIVICGCGSAASFIIRYVLSIYQGVSAPLSVSICSRSLLQSACGYHP
jgi:hypothetical protein